MSKPNAEFPPPYGKDAEEKRDQPKSACPENSPPPLPLDQWGNVCSCRSRKEAPPEGIPRRTFLQWAGIGTAATTGMASSAWGANPSGASTGETIDHFVPVEKNLPADWIASLTAKGEPTWYEGKDLDTIAMPIGGICAGQVYLNGEGRLVGWSVFNEAPFSGYGATSYQAGRKIPPGLQQGFALWIHSGGKTVVRSLSREGFSQVRFCGEYPIGFVQYADQEVPVSVRLEAFSPFIPLDAAHSGLPATVLEFTLTNTSDAPVSVTLAGWLENGICSLGSQWRYGMRSYEVVRGETWAMLLGRAREAEPLKPPRAPKVLADFEGDTYGDWKVEGEAFGRGPARGTLPHQQPVTGFEGKGLVNTYLDGDKPHGKLISPPFKIERNFISFLIGGGNHPGKTCINLLVEGRVVRTATGKNQERLEWHNWDVRDLAGKEAQIEIVDTESGPWGHINIDQIELRDAPRAASTGPITEQSDFGTMGLALLEPEEAMLFSSALPEGPLPEKLFTEDGRLAADKTTERPLTETLIGAMGKQLKLGPNGSAKVVFVVSWHFPNRYTMGIRRGNFYATRFSGADAVVDHLVAHWDRLCGQTRLWHQTWYEATLPRWLLDRLFSTISILATETCQWWANGRFWAWEGVGCCHGTCGHVWNYAHGPARLFPELERSVRQMQDFNPEAGFIAESGAIRFRGEGWGLWAGDSQPGYVLKAYREHLCSGDEQFLKKNWPYIRKALEFLFEQDRQDGQWDGLLEGKQHNTYDIDFYGANTMVGSLYLAACRAAEEMAKELGQTDFAATCRQIFQQGRENTMRRLFNGEYFIQDVDLQKHPKHQYGPGCLADQLFGQSWAHQVGLGYIYPKEAVLSALRAIWKYCWTPDVAEQNKAHPPQRWFAVPGEAGLFVCTWPKSKHLGPESVLYRDEVWTGIEYQVASHMVWEGMLTEALAICRAIHERYHPAKRNPWNEVECGDHYSRAMASYGVFLALCGFEYDGPKGHIGFAPRLQAEDFRAAFTGAAGWGLVQQKRSTGRQTEQIELRYGTLHLRSLQFALPEGVQLRQATARLADRTLAVATAQDGSQVRITLREPIEVSTGQTLSVELVY